MNTVRSRLALLFGLLGSLALPAVSHAGPRDFVVFAPGMGASEAEAKPYLDTFFAYLEKQLHWPAKSGHGTYLDDEKAVGQYIAKENPGYALVPPSYFLQLTCKKAPITPLASIVGLSDTTGSGRFHVVVKDEQYKTLADLKGKRIASNHLQDPRFVSKVVLGGKYDAEKDFVLAPTNSPIKPFKEVDRGQADAALVDDAQLQHMESLPFGKSLKVVYSSEALPPFPVVAFNSVVSAADRAAVGKALVGMCQSEEGAKVCKSLQITKFAPVNAAAFQHAVKQYCE